MSTAAIFLKAHQIASEAHSGQTRRDGLTPYFTHVRDVVRRTAQRYGGDKDYFSLITIATLHDVVEDTPITAADLLAAGIPQDIVDAVVALTKTEGERYTDCLYRVKANPLAAKVKVADMLSNLSDSPTERQIFKYAQGLVFLLTP